MLLAAGRGTRLRPLTDQIPKAMVEVGGVPVLERNVRWLREQGITELAINLHHLADVPRLHFGDGSVCGVSIRWSYEPELLGTAGAMRPLADFLAAGPFLLLYADNLIRCDLDALRVQHDRLGAVATVALWERDDVSASGVAELDADGMRVLRFVEKPARAETSSRWVSAGLLLCEPRLLDAVGKPPTDVGRDVLPALISVGEIVGGYRMGEGEWLEWIDTPTDLARVEAALYENGAGS